MSIVARERERPLAREERRERLAVDELHREDLLAALLADVEDARDVRVRHAPRELHLATKALERAGRAGELRPEHLQRDVSSSSRSRAR